MSEPESAPPVTFTWADPEVSSWWLAAFIFLSFLMHSAAFFIFQDKSRPPGRAPRTAPSVQTLSAAADPATRSPEATALLEWIATQDPALVAKIPTMEPRGLTDVPYRPSYQAVRTQPLPAPAQLPAVQVPVARDPFESVQSLSPRMKSEPPIVPPQSTRIATSAALRARLAQELSMVPQAKADAGIRPTVILIGVSAKGEPRFAFLQQSSENPALDAEALQFIRTARFEEMSGAVQWGSVTFLWGDDAYAQPAVPTDPPK